MEGNTLIINKSKRFNNLDDFCCIFCWFVGSVFVAVGEDMKNTYAPYCRHHDDVMGAMATVSPCNLLAVVFGCSTLMALFQWTGEQLLEMSFLCLSEH